jgi:hypothetical protein
VFRLAAILLSSLWLSGCFIFEEIRKGDALIEQHSSGWREKKKSMQQAETEAAKAEAETQTLQTQNTGPGVQDKLSDWWRETVEEGPVKTDSSDKIISCQIGGKFQFLRESDCQLRRGRAIETKAKSNATVKAPSKSKPGT